MCKVISNDCLVTINLNELVAIRASFLEEVLTEDEVNQISNELRVRMTFDSLYGQTDRVIWEMVENTDMLPQYGQIETGVIPEPEFEMVDLVSPSWTIQVPRRITK